MSTARAKPATVNDAQIADGVAAVGFLEKLRPGGPWVLTAIVPDGPTETTTATSADAINAFVRANDGKKNIYYSVNPTRTAMTSKAAKKDIAAIEFLLADLDPNEGERPEDAKARYLTALETQQPACTATIDSGNGIQVLWRLAEPIKLEPPTIVNGKKVFPAVVADVEARVKARMETMGSVAGTQNIDRILRLPGTTNLPNKKKLKDGRVACPTKLIRFDGATCSLDDFPVATEAKAKAESASAPAGADIDWSKVAAHLGWLKTVADLPMDFNAKGRMIVAHGGNLKDLNDDLKQAGLVEHHYASWSDVSFALAAIFKADGRYAREQIAAALMCDLECNQHVTKHSDEDKRLRAVERLLARSHEPKWVDANIAELNETYALVIVGGKTAILKTEGNDISFLTIGAFDQWHANKHVTWNDKKIPLGKFWMSHAQRRQYSGITFDPSRHEVPGQYNLWRGFAVEPMPGDCSKLLAHLKDNICRGDNVLYNWVVGWFADIVQHPARKSGTSLVLRGPQGVGKTKIGEVIGSLLVPHYSLVSDPRYVTGRFNSHLISCLLLHCDESFWAGDRAAEGRLKDLVTGADHFIEFKGREPIRIRNYVRLLVCGNQNWLVPAGFAERRFATLDVGEDHMQDNAYFAAIDAEMDNGGREALLYHLLNFDLTTVNLRIIPKTTALLDQKLSSLDAEQGWWLDVLSRGELPWGCELNSNFCPSDRLSDRYVRHAGRHGVRRKSIQTQLGIFLTKHVPGLRRHTRGCYFIWTRTGGIKETTGTTYEFPSLEECRMAFASALQHDFTWDEKVAWTHEPPPDAAIDDTGI